MRFQHSLHRCGSREAGRGSGPMFGWCGPGGGTGGSGWGDQGGGRGGGRRRVFDSGELRLVLLQLISDQPRHGYDLIRAVEQRSGGAYAPSPGVVYPTITMLHDMGHIDERQTEGSRRLFAISEDGTRHLDAHRGEVDALFERLAALGAMASNTDGGPVRRAMHNLRNVLQQRLGRDDVEPAALHDVAAILDEAARNIERM